MSKSPTKYIFVTGGVLSGVGKGISAASIGTLLKARGFSVNIQKCDQYLNVDAGTLNPAEHGECYVTHDGAETDLDLGHYERFLDVELMSKSSLMTGRVLRKVIEGERAGKYLGKTVQMVPHVTGVVQEEIEACAEGYDVHIVEIGGTVGDIEGMHFIEAIRELSLKLGRENCIFVHVVYVPFLGTSKEYKTKPAQNAVKDLRNVGIAPDVLLVRTEGEATKDVVPKLALFGGVSGDAIALLPNAKSIYDVPLTVERAGIMKFIEKRLNLPKKPVRLKAWKEVVQRAHAEYDTTIRIGVVAKYLNNQDTYFSVFEALKSAAMWQDANVSIVWVDAEELELLSETQREKILGSYDGLVVPGGFGYRGVEGKVMAARYALKHKKPYLGLCLGLQVMVIAAARMHGILDANSAEFTPKGKNNVIHTMEDQIGREGTGGSMRLGSYPCILPASSLARSLYGAATIHERHRHRYEANNAYCTQYESWGIKASGVSPDEHLVEIIEALDHPYMISSQFHPEFASRPNRPHPLFRGLITACLGS